MADIVIDRVVKEFGSFRALQEVSLTVNDGEFVALLGPSGCGKTTLLRIIAGLETQTAGRVIIGGQDVSNLAPRKRGLAMVFQNYAVFPHMTVFENVAFGLRMQKAPQAEVKRKVERAAALLHIESYLDRYPAKLSGGQRQRVAVARALAVEPAVLLMDEPLSNLDPTLRQSTRDELRSMLHRVGVPALFVTHDQEDAFAVADRIALIKKGILLQIGTPEDLYDRPASLSVASFIGRSTILPAEDLGDVVAVTIAGRRRQFRATRPVGAKLPSALVVLRPDALEIAAEGDDAGWRGEVVNRRFTGGSAVYRVKVDEGTVLEVESGVMDLREGDTTGVRVVREPLPLVAAE
jgi:ABC-type Fe3+/spermidine/putrescine transport system ATPase subunit